MKSIWILTLCILILVVGIIFLTKKSKLPTIVYPKLFKNIKFWHSVYADENDLVGFHYFLKTEKAQTPDPIYFLTVGSRNGSDNAFDLEFTENVPLDVKSFTFASYFLKVDKKFLSVPDFNYNSFVRFDDSCTENCVYACLFKTGFWGVYTINDRKVFILIIENGVLNFYEYSQINDDDKTHYWNFFQEESKF